MEIPPTPKGQIDALLSALGVSDFTAALTAIPQLRATQQGATDWQGQRQSLFASLGGSGDVPEHYDFAAGIAAQRSEVQALWTALGVTDHAAAVTALNNLRSQINSLNANQTTMFAALGSTDLAGAMRAIKDIDGRIEAGVTAGVIARAASAGLPKPVEKVPGGETPGTAKTATRAEFGAMDAKAQLAFSQAGGQIVEATS